LKKNFKEWNNKMTTKLSERIADFHVRLGKLETERLQQRKKDSVFEDLTEFIAVLVALFCAYYGLGLPNHPYQFVFAVLIVASLYHKEIFPRPQCWHEWLLLPLNILLLSMLLKIVIGGGDPKPFHWLALPAIEGGLTSFSLSWQQVSASEWTLPLTTIQTFLLVMTLFGKLIGFEIFCALTTFILMLLALPALVSFNWNFALPSMIAALFSFYLQADDIQAVNREAK
jgi:hypothetical protein